MSGVDVESAYHILIQNNEINRCLFVRMSYNRRKLNQKKEITMSATLNPNYFSKSAERNKTTQCSCGRRVEKTELRMVDRKEVCFNCFKDICRNQLTSAQR